MAINNWAPAFAGITVLGLSTVYAADSNTEQANRLLQKALHPPKVAYRGALTVTHWYGKNTRVQEVRVDFRPPDHFRWEFLHPDGSKARVVVSDGQMEMVQLPRKQRILKGSAHKSVGKIMPEAVEWELLQKNYTLSVQGSDRICGRDAWVLQLTPIVDGKLSQRLWLDKQTGVILENRRYRPQGNFAVLSRFNHFEPNAVINERIFIITSVAGEAEEHDFEPDFFSFDELKSFTGRHCRLPAELPAGFVFESADTFMVNGKPVDHIRYTDGVSVLSIFDTTTAVRVPTDDENNPATDEGPNQLRMDETGAVLQTRAGNHHYTLVSDVSEPVLRTISASLK